jgi:hypothetical protein
MRRLRLDVMVAVSLAAVVSLDLAAAKPPKPQPVPATLTFRCLVDNPGGFPSPCDALDAGGTDRIRDDGTSYVGSIHPDGIFTPQLATPGTGRFVNMLFGPMLADTRTCVSVGNCHPDGPTNSETIDWTNLALDNFQFRVKPFIPGTSDDLPGLLFGMSTCGEPLEGMVHTTFWFPDGNGHWGFNFNPRGYPGTSPVTIVRETLVTWTVEAGTDHVGELLSWGHSGIRGKNGPSREGRFNMPFKATIVSNGLPTGAGSCT